MRRVVKGVEFAWTAFVVLAPSPRLQVNSTMLLSVQEVNNIGLGFLGISGIHQRALGCRKCNDIVKEMIGSSPEVLASLWHDLMNAVVLNAACVGEDSTLVASKHF